MECRKCCKAFCKNRNANPDTDFGCDQGISFLQANILEKPITVQPNQERNLIEKLQRQLNKFCK